MRRVDLAKRLIDAANNRERRLLLSQNHKIADVSLADEIRKACYMVWASDPTKAQNAAKAITALAKLEPSPETKAIAFWVTGIADITKGRFEVAVEELTAAEREFNRLGLKTDAAQTQVAKLLALGMVGRYDEAARTGRKALKVFISTGDELAAGKIEMNLSNVAARREQHREAEGYAISARRRFKKAGVRSWQTMAENDLANTYAELNQFDRAEKFYRLALDGARAEKMTVTEAEIEASLGNLARLQGKYAEALRHLESSRQMYDGLSMPHQSAIADLEIADIYSELNLRTEAVEIYERVSKTFQRLKLGAEEARSRLNHGRTAAGLGDGATARRELERAGRLFEKEKNDAGRASTLLALARLQMENGQSESASKLIAEAATVIKRAENPRHQIHLELLTGEMLRRSGKCDEAALLFGKVLTQANAHRQPAAAEFALNALGKIAAVRGDTSAAAANYIDAIKIVERMRSSLETEFSMTFFAARLEPFQDLAKLLIEQGRITDAFKVVESGRSRSLLDSLQNSLSQPKGTVQLKTRLNELRSELNVFYKRLDVATGSDRDKLSSSVATLEKQITATTRQIKSLGNEKTSDKQKRNAGFSVKALQQQLEGATLVEFVEIEGEFSAFVVTRSRIEYIRGLGTTAEIKQILEDLRFQFGSLRYGSDIQKRFGTDLIRRTDSLLADLYQTLLLPIAGHLKGDRLIIVPTGLLYYVPFHALNDGVAYVAEKFDTNYAPSAAIWQALHDRKTKKPGTSLLIGYADERIPLVEEEIRQIARVLPGARKLTGDNAGYAAIMNEIGRYELLHIACHGQFRADNPMFSSLHLADGWVTVRDIIAQKLKAKLVTLSACETGLNELFAGDEILGLARGFLAAGAESLIVSLWSVNDEATGRLMAEFYQNLQRGSSIAASLRAAQMGFIERGEHPYFWSPFVLIGR